VLLEHRVLIRAIRVDLLASNWIDIQLAHVAYFAISFNPRCLLILFFELADTLDPKKLETLHALLVEHLLDFVLFLAFELLR